MINTPMMFCRLCLAENADAVDICPYCGTPNMVKPYTVSITVEVEVEAFTSLEAVHTAVECANGTLMTYITNVDVVQDSDNDDQ